MYSSKTFIFKVNTTDIVVYRSYINDALYISLIAVNIN